MTGAASDIGRLAALHFERVHPVLGRTTATVTTIEGGTARNVVPDHCSFFLDVRSTPSYTHQELVDQIQAVVSGEVHVHSSRLISVDTSEDESIVQACVAAHPGAKPFGSPTLSDWIFLKGIPTVKMGPGDSDLSHTAGEHVSIEQLERGVEVYQHAIKLYFERES